MNLYLLYVHALLVFIFLGCLVEEKNKYMERLDIGYLHPKLEIPGLTCPGRESNPGHAHTSLDAGKICVNVHVSGDFLYYIPVSVFRVRIATSEPLKRVTGRIF